MADVREQILDRLFTVLEGVTGFGKIRRNVQDLDDTSVYAVLLDGSEVADESDPPRRGASAPRRVILTPSVVISAPGTWDEVGTTVNTQRARVIKAVLEDATLKGYTIDDSIRFVGSETVLQTGRTPILAMNIEFGFTYLLKLSDL